MTLSIWSAHDHVVKAEQLLDVLGGEHVAVEQLDQGVDELLGREGPRHLGHVEEDLVAPERVDEVEGHDEQVLDWLVYSRRGSRPS